ncbi:hypothetical protein D3C75_521140 [compost metagenome]
MRNIRQHITHGFLQPNALNASFMIDIQQPVQVNQHALQLQITAEQQQSFM